ncbi:hypothetical protein H5410_016653 [Solanum commersonii]|uniref:Uncharacterized protein n=1 Tax=Solanum commersonii TaxID=4109 RepID=A0A9J5ZWU5_SOLCO|nr:hypothetical protein H5410_016653 [Solanum commersonii]
MGWLKADRAIESRRESMNYTCLSSTNLKNSWAIRSSICMNKPLKFGRKKWQGGHIGAESTESMHPISTRRYWIIMTNRDN